MERADLMSFAKKLTPKEKLFLISQLTKDLSIHKIIPQKKIAKLKGVIPKNSFPNLEDNLKQLKQNSIKHLEEEWKYE